MNALSGFNGLELFFAISAIVGGFFVLLKLVTQFAGGDLHHDAGGGDVDVHHADSDIGFKFLSLHGLSSFFLMFGLVGLALYRQSRVVLPIAILGGVAAGIVAVWVIGKVFLWAGRLQASGTLQTEDAIGSVGTVYLGIPANGTGRVSVDVRSHLREYDARERNGVALVTGTPIRVVDVNANVLVVQKLSEEGI